MVGIEELVYAVCLWHKREDVWYIRECGGERIHMDEYCQMLDQIYLI